MKAEQHMDTHIFWGRPLAFGAICSLFILPTACDDTNPESDEILVINSDGSVVGREGAPGQQAAGDGGGFATDNMTPVADVPMTPSSTVEEVRINGVSITEGRSSDLTIELPDNVSSLTILGFGDTSVFYCVEHLVGPNGAVLVSEMPPGVTLRPTDSQLSPCPGAFRSANRSATSATEITELLAPNNASVAVTPGTWTFRIGAFGQFARVTSFIDVILLIKTEAVPQVRGEMDVHLFFTGTLGWTAANAPTNPQFQAALERMRSFYTEVGIEIGAVTYDDIPAEFREVDAGPQGPGPYDGKLHRMFRLNTYSTGIGLFFVDRIGDAMLGGVIGGIAGGTPGPSLQAGTSRSGIAVATALDPNPQSIGHIMGHETGHFLGLYHTIELAGLGQVTDQINDTPEGFIAQDNLMFPTVTSGAAQFSDEQGWVLHRSPVIVGLPATGAVQ